ncbi:MULTISPECIES: MFS transporter [unclassified Streptomyces]|uniref:MFS transporter n=1 Tax=unclassified Streptomyces TaxID=2593676 RepID=UPI002E228006|nr:MFS transporter [Streptomyces sp. NBC_01023]
MSEATHVQNEATDRAGVRRAVAAGAIGNFVEWFDFGVYGYLAPVLALQFFPDQSRSAGMLSTFAIFGVAFLIRPAGAVFFGRLGDRLGRRITLSAIVVLMSLSTAVIGVLPGFATIGIAAPLLLLAMRLVQGFSAGGEFAGASTMVVEYAPPNRRGLYVSFLSISTFAASLAGVCLTALLTSGAGEEAMRSWGWRIPFLVSLPLGLVGLYLRTRVDETPEFRALVREQKVESAPLAEVLRTQRKPMVTLFCIIMINAVAYYVLGTYWPNYLSENAGLPRSTALWSAAAAYGLLMVLAPVFGMLADRYGRKPMMLYSTVGLLVMTVPAFMLSGVGGYWPAFLGQALFVLFAGPTSPVSSLVTAELFPARIRYSASAIGYNLSFMLFGGTAPYVSAFLIDRTGSKLAPAYYICAIAACSLIGVATMLKETGPRASPALTGDKTSSSPATSSATSAAGI